MTTAVEAAHPYQAEQQTKNHHHARVNVGTTERWISAIAGGALVAYGLRSRSLGGLLVTAAGGAIIARGIRGHCPLYGSLNLDTAHKEAAPPEEYFRRGIHVETSVTIAKTPTELYQFWRDLRNLPRIMDHIESVSVIDANRSHWAAKAPAGTTVEWDAQIINDEPNRLIAWQSLENASVANSGSVRFLAAPGDRGTEVHVTLDYIPPVGRLGALVAKLFGREPSQQIKEDLRRFKQVMETGEVPTIDGQSAGAGRGREKAILGARPLQKA